MLLHRQLHCLDELTVLSAAQCNLACAAQALFAAAACKRDKPISVQHGFALETDVHMEHEGRTITAEFERCYIVSTYFPFSGNSQAGLEITHWTADQNQGRPIASTAYRT